MPKSLLTAAVFPALVFSVASLSVCTSANDQRPNAKPTQQPTAANGQKSSQNAGTNTNGETISEMSKRIWIIFQDKNNNYWFGSDGQGVYRFDGKVITQFTTKHGLPNDRIREIQQDKSGNMFFTTLDGISKFDGRKFTTLAVTESDASSKEWKLESGDLWFKGNSMENGPYRYDGKSLHHLKFPTHYLEDEFYRNNPKPVASPLGVYTIYKDSRGDLWFGTVEFGLCRFDGESVSWMYERELTYPPGGGSFGIRSIIEDKEGKFWICNTRYRYTISPDNAVEQGKVLIKYKREKGIDHLKTPDGDDQIYFQWVIKDNKQDLWMLTYRGGVWRYDGKSMTHYPVKDVDRVIGLIAIFKDNRGDLWLGTEDAGAYKFNGRTFEPFK